MACLTMDLAYDVVSRGLINFFYHKVRNFVNQNQRFLRGNFPTVRVLKMKGVRKSAKSNKSYESNRLRGIFMDIHSVRT
jgi:hypothetical protein